MSLAFYLVDHMALHHYSRIVNRVAVGLLAMFIGLLGSCSTREHDFLIYIGTYTGKGSDGIYLYRFNSNDGHLTPIGLAAKTENPSWLVIDSSRQFLYSVNETGEFQGKPTGSISAFSIDRESGGLTALQQISSRGAAPCHLSIDRTGRHLMVANYTGGSAAIFPIEKNGQLGVPGSFIQHAGFSVHPERQNGPHAHSIQSTPDNRFVTVTDLGMDKVMVYAFDAENGSLDTLHPVKVTLPPGSGPRHLAYSRDGKSIYVLNELTSTVTVFSLNTKTGEMTPMQSEPILPDSFVGINTGAEILVDATGKFLYVSNRGDNSIGLFSIEPVDGRLTPVEWFPSGGRGPRHMDIDPTGQWLMVANQLSDNLALFKINSSDGRLTPAGKPQPVSAPVCVRFMPVQ